MEVTDKEYCEILSELRYLVKLEQERLAVDQGIHDAIHQMVDYLREHQSIIDYVLKDKTKQNQEGIREITQKYGEVVALANNAVISNDKYPVYVLNKSYQIKMAEGSLIPTRPNNAAYYRVGFLGNLGAAYQTIDEGYPTFVNTAQNLRLVSTSANDAPGGTGVQGVLVGGLDVNGNRFFEIVALNGATPVTTVNQFTQLDILNSTATGTNAGAVGTVSITNTGATTTFGAIAPSNNAWYSGRVFTDTRAAGYIFQWSVSSYGGASRFHLRVNHIAGNFNALLSRSMGLADNSTAVFNFPIPIKVPKSSLVTVRGIAKSSNTEVTTAFQLYTREDTLPDNL